ncbi:cysteine hydrolase [Patescibacteria group bacterium]|nr:cysteine hydrolase [Patescibacteria group bacterium]
MIGKYWKDWGPPKSVLARGNHWWKLYPELHNEPADIYVTKPKYNAFWGSDLEAVLRGLAVESLIFTGIMTDVCVQTTLVDAFHRDFNPIIAVDATCTATPYKKEALLMIESCYGRALTPCVYVPCVYCN